MLTIMAATMTGPFPPKGKPGRVLIIILWGLTFGNGHANELCAKDKNMTTVQMTLWKAIDTLVQQAPWSKEKIEAALSTTLVEKEEPSNQSFRFYKSDRIALQDGVVISSVDWRIKIRGKHPGLLGIDLQGHCITLDEVRRHYPLLEITDAPRGRSMDEETVYTAMLPWGELSFGFKEKARNCLAGVGFKPKQ